MSFYFSPFPSVIYDPTGEDRPVLCTDITRRFKLSDVTKSSKYVFYDYEIKDRDRPDVMAEKYYGNSTLDWLLFLTNEIFDPYFQWPLNYAQFDAYIRQKYGSASNAEGTVHHYEQIITSRREYTSNYDGTTITIPEQALVVDYTTYLANITSSRAVSTYDWEEAENNKRRLIKILDKQHVPELLQEVRGIFS